MPIINMFPGGGGTRIPLEPVTNFALVPMDGHVLISWTDPVDKVATPGGELAAEWKFTKVIRKEGSYPTSSIDGTLVVKSDIRNQYSENAYIDSGLSNGTTYYYAAYAYTSVGAESEPVKGTAEPTDATPEWTEGFTPTSDHYGLYGLGTTGNHYILLGGTTRSDYSGTDVYKISSIEYGTYTEQQIGAISQSRWLPSNCMLGESSIFVYGEGGYSSLNPSKNIYAVTKDLTCSQPTTSKLENSRGGGRVRTLGDCAIGYYDRYCEKISQDYTITKSPTYMSLKGMRYVTAEVSNNRMFILSGLDTSHKPPDTYNGYSVTEDLTMSFIDFDGSSVPSWKIGIDKGSSSFHGVAVFGGGYNNRAATNYSGCLDTVFTLNDEVTITELEPLTSGSWGPVGISFKNFILFLGGRVINNYLLYSDYYDNSLTKRGNINNTDYVANGSYYGNLNGVFGYCATIEDTSLIAQFAGVNLPTKNVKMRQVKVQ